MVASIRLPQKRPRLSRSIKYVFNQPIYPTLAQVCTAMRNPAFELDSEEAALLLLAVNQAALGGYNFTPLETAFIDVIRRQLCGDCDDFEDTRDDDEDSDDDVCICDVPHL